MNPRWGFAYPINNGGVWDPIAKVWRKPSLWHRKGVSDIGGIWTQKPLYVETKSPGNKPTPEQREFLRLAINHGAIAFWTDDPLDAIKTLISYTKAIN